jgi:hypothetical protein
MPLGPLTTLAIWCIRPRGYLSAPGEVTEAAAAGQNNRKKDSGFFAFGWLRALAGGSGVICGVL